MLPVLWTGLSEHHMSFGGTITLDNAAFAAVVEGVVRSVLRHGFRRIVLLNAHGGNENALRTIADDLTPKLGVPIVQFTYWYAAAVAIAKILETQGGLQHACEAETSMMMAVRPELVARIAFRWRNPTRPGVADVAAAACTLAQHRQPVGARRDRQPGSGDARKRASGCSTRSPPPCADKLCDKELWDCPEDIRRNYEHRTDGQRTGGQRRRWRTIRRCWTCCATIWT